MPETGTRRKRKKKTKIKRASISFISLCPRGKNCMPVLYKSQMPDENEHLVKAQFLTKIGEDFAEQGELLAVVWAPDVPDTDGDFAEADVVKAMAHDYMRNGGQIDVRHDGAALAKERAFVAESFIVSKGDERFSDFTDYDGEPVDVTGSWAVVLKILDPELRKEYREGGWNGVSMFGTAEMEPIEKEDPVSLTKEDVQEIVKEALATVVKAVAPAPEPKTDDNAPQFKGDAKDRKAVAKHLEALESYKLLKSVDWNDPESVAHYHQKLKKAEEIKNEGQPTELEKAQADAKAAAERVAQLEKASVSTVPSDGTTSTDEDTPMVNVQNMSKQQNFRANVGRGLANMINSKGH